MTHLKRRWCWEILKVGGKGDDRGWDGWIASLTQWTWVWANSGRLWRTGRPGVLQSMGSQRVRRDWSDLACTHTSLYIYLSHYLYTHIYLSYGYRKAMKSLDSILKKQRHFFAWKCLYSQSYGFSSGHVWMWELDNKKFWVPKNWCIWTVGAGEDSWESLVQQEYQISQS